MTLKAGDSPRSAEDAARQMLDRMGVRGALNFSSGTVIELANLIAKSGEEAIRRDERRIIIIAMKNRRREVVKLGGGDRLVELDDIIAMLEAWAD